MEKRTISFSPPDISELEKVIDKPSAKSVYEHFKRENKGD